MAKVIGGLQSEDPRLIGPYRLVGRLGSGGMGRVFLGLSAGGRPVAVKVIRDELAADQEFRIRFSREVAAARRVNGLFTALVVDADVDGPVPWLATAYVTGPSLSDAVSSYGPMPGRPALALAAGLAEGLSAIHAVSVVHCDLKPSNVLLSQDGPRVIDFGISRAAEPVSVTGPGLIAGSPGFMSPEQAMEEEVGLPSDVFSLGAVLAFAVTGRGPFGEGSRPELAYRLVYCQPDLDLVPAGLRPLIELCLAKDPSQRPTAGALLAEVAAMQPAPSWLPDLTLGAFAEYCAPSAVLTESFPSAATPATGHSLPAGPGLPDPGRPPSGGDRNSRRRRWMSLTVAGVTAGILAASVAVSLAVSGATRHPSARPSEPKLAATRDAPGPAPADIIPAMQTFTLPAQKASSSSSPPASASPTATASATPGPSPATAAPVPRITSVGTYQKGAWVYLDVHYADPGHDALGFGFTGSNGDRWAEGSYPFSSPDGGVVGPDSIAYPLDLECGTARQHTAEVEAWIYDAAGTAGQPVVVHLACTS